MTKARDSLREKKKKIKQEEDKVLFSMTIEAKESGDIMVYGPIEDENLVLRILSGAMAAVADHNTSKRQGIVEEKEAKKQEAKKADEEIQNKKEPLLVTPDGEPAGESKIEVVH